MKRIVVIDKIIKLKRKNKKGRNKKEKLKWRHNNYFKGLKLLKKRRLKDYERKKLLNMNFKFNQKNLENWQWKKTMIFSTRDILTFT